MNWFCGEEIFVWFRELILWWKGGDVLWFVSGGDVVEGVAKVTVIEVRAVQRVEGEGDWCGVLFGEQYPA
jgi:hypothetical protein